MLLHIKQLNMPLMLWKLFHMHKSDEKLPVIPQRINMKANYFQKTENNTFRIYYVFGAAVNSSRRVSEPN